MITQETKPVKTWERFNICNKRQIPKVSKLIDKHYILQKIHNKGVKDQLSDQKINNTRELPALIPLISF